MAQAIRANLLASAMAATFVGRRTSNAARRPKYFEIFQIYSRWRLGGDSGQKHNSRLGGGCVKNFIFSVLQVGCGGRI